MTITEANAVNVLLHHITQTPDALGELPTIDQVAAAGEILAAKAHKALSAGITAPEQVRNWRTS